MKYGEESNLSKKLVNYTIDNLLDGFNQAQKSSFDHFAYYDLHELLVKNSPLYIDYAGNEVNLENIEFAHPKYTPYEAKSKGLTYSRGLSLFVKSVNKSSGELYSQKIHIMDLPFITSKGTFIINGTEHFVPLISEVSPGFYCLPLNQDLRAHFSIYSKDLLELKVTADKKVEVKIDGFNYINLMSFLRVVGFKNYNEIEKLFTNSDFIYQTDCENNKLYEIISLFNPYESKTHEQIKFSLESKLYSSNLSKAGRFKVNKKLDVLNHLEGQLLANDLVESETHNLIFPKRHKLTKSCLQYLDKNRHLFTREIIGVPESNIEYDFSNLISILDTNPYLAALDSEKKLAMIRSQNYKPADELANNYINTLGILKEEYIRNHGIENFENIISSIENTLINEKLYFKLAKVEVLDIIRKNKKNEEIVLSVVGNNSNESSENLTSSDFIASIGYYINLYEGYGRLDDLNHLGNQRIKSCGELIKNRFIMGLFNLKKHIKKQLKGKSISSFTTTSLISSSVLSSPLRDFFYDSKWVQPLSSVNLIDETVQLNQILFSYKNKIFESYQDSINLHTHHSHYSRLFPIYKETDSSFGVQKALTIHARINKLGFIEAPYYKVDHITTNYGINSLVKNEIIYLTADEEEEFLIADGSTQIDSNNHIIDDNVYARHFGKIRIVAKDKVDLIDYSSTQILSFTAACIPFVEYNSINQSSEAANLIRKAVPIINPRKAVVTTGYEKEILSKFESFANKLNQDITGYTDSKKNVVDSKSFTFGNDVKVAFMFWEGYNFKESLIISNRLIRKDLFTSVHIEEFEVEVRETRFGNEEITSKIPNIWEDYRRRLDSKGIIFPGTEVEEGDILVGIVSPYSQFGEKVGFYMDASLRVPSNSGGIVKSVEYFSRENGDNLRPGVLKLVKVYVAKKRCLMEGDVLATRHGDKGVISKIIREEDMPYLPNGEPIDVIMNPLSIVSKKNLALLYEAHLGYACEKLNFSISVPPFNNFVKHELTKIMNNASVINNGKVELICGKTGLKYDNKVVVGVVNMFKVNEMVEDKLMARCVGPYTQVTQQPTELREHQGGQKITELDIWALEAYGAAHILQEMLTVKSDDIIGRNKVFRAIIDGKNVPGPSLPESFRLLTRELQSLGIYVELINRDTKNNEANESLVEDHLDKFNFDF